MWRSFSVISQYRQSGPRLHVTQLPVPTAPRGQFHPSQHTAHLTAQCLCRRAPRDCLPPARWASFLGSVSGACEKVAPVLPGIPVGNEWVIWYWVNNVQGINPHLPLDIGSPVHNPETDRVSVPQPWETGRRGHLQKAAEASGGFLQHAADSFNYWPFVKTIKVLISPHLSSGSAGAAVPSPTSRARAPAFARSSRPGKPHSRALHPFPVLWGNTVTEPARMSSKKPNTG